MAGLAIVDGDILSYRCAAANEQRFVTVTHKETAVSREFDTATDFRAWAGASADSFDIVPGQRAEELHLAFAAMKRSLENIVKGAGCDSYHIVISGDNNFRQDLLLPTKYKDSRKETIKPLQLADCKQYLIRFQEAEVAEGEADDLMAAYAYQGYKAGERVVQCSIDKDAKHGPWWLYDWTTMSEAVLIEGYGELTCTLRDTGKKNAKGDPVTQKIIKGTGRAFLWYQLVFGDPVDCYKPCELAKAKFGEVGAYDLLKHAKNDKEALEAVVARYKLWYDKPVTYRAWDGSLHTKDWLQIMQMYADCCFMRRWPGDELNITKLLDKLGINYKDTP